jgi:hypothetical protein
MQLHDDDLWRELDALGEHQVRLRLAQGHYRERKRLLVEEWLREQAQKRSLEQASSPGQLESLRSRDEKMAIVAAAAAVIAAMMATIAATVSVLTYLRPP